VLYLGFRVEKQGRVICHRGIKNLIFTLFSSSDWIYSSSLQIAPSLIHLSVIFVIYSFDLVLLELFVERRLLKIAKTRVEVFLLITVLPEPL